MTKNFIRRSMQFARSAMEKDKTTLSLFSYNPQAQPANNTGASALSAEMKTFYDMTLIDEATPNLVHDQFGQKRPVPKNSGKTVEFRKYATPNKATAPLSEGVSPDPQALSVSTVSSTVSQYGRFFVLSDMLTLTSIDNNIVQAIKACGKQSGMTLDTVTRDVLQAGTNVFYCPKINASTGAETAVTSRADLDGTAQLTVNVVMQVVAKLRAQNAPTINGDYVAIIHPYAAYDLMRDPEWIDAHKYAAAENLYRGEIGKIAGVRFVSTSEAKIYRGTGCPSGLSVFGTLFFGEGAYGVTELEGGGLQTIVKQLGEGDDPLDQRSTVGWKAAKTAEILVPNYLVRVESCSARFSASAEAN